jgi:hypothetical protein
MKKTLLYFVILVVLGFGVYYFLIGKKDNTYSASEAGFSVDTASVGKIFLSGNDGKSVTLDRTDSGWKVDKQYNVLTATLNTLLQTLAAQRAIAPVPESAHNYIVKAMAGNSIKVELYDRKGEKMRVFYVGFEAPRYTGTYMLMEGAEKPYIVQIEGNNGYLTPRYSPDIKDWRDRVVFNVAPEQIQSIAVRYPHTPINSFVLTQQGNNVTVNADSSLIRNNAFNVRRATVYLKFFQGVYSEGYMNGLRQLDSSLRTAPERCIIEVTDKRGKTQRADIYWMHANRRSKNLLTSDVNTADTLDPDHFYAIINNNRDTVLIQNFIFEKIFRNAYEFYQPDQTGPAPEGKHPMKQPQPMPGAMIKTK